MPLFRPPADLNLLDNVIKPVGNANKAGSIGLGTDAGHIHMSPRGPVLGVEPYNAGAVTGDYTPDMQAILDLLRGKSGRGFVPGEGRNYTMKGQLLMNAQAYSDIVIEGEAPARFDGPTFTFTGGPFDAALVVHGDDDVNLGTTIRAVRWANVKFDASIGNYQKGIALQDAQSLTFEELWLRGFKSTGYYLAQSATGNLLQIHLVNPYCSLNGTAGAGYDVFCDDGGTNTQMASLLIERGRFDSTATENVHLFATGALILGTQMYDSHTGLRLVKCLSTSVIAARFESHIDRHILVDAGSLSTEIAGLRCFPVASMHNAIRVQGTSLGGRIEDCSFGAASGMVAGDALISSDANSLGWRCSGNKSLGVGAGVLYGDGAGGSWPSGNDLVGDNGEHLLQLITDRPSGTNHWVLRENGVTKWVVYLVGNDLRFYDGVADRTFMLAGGGLHNTGVGTFDGGVGLDTVDHQHSGPNGATTGNTWHAVNVGGTVTGPAESPASDGHVHAYTAPTGTTDGHTATAIENQRHTHTG